MNPNKLGSAAPGGGVEKTGNFSAEQNPVKNFEVEKNSEKPKTGAEIFEMKMSQIANRREMIEQMKMEGKLGFDDYKTKKHALDLVENKLTKLYDIYENREVNEAKREKELELRNEQFEESKDFLRRLSQDKELPRDEKMKLMERFSQRLVDCHDKVEKVKKAREMDERVYQLFGGKSGEEKAEAETKEKTEKETEGKTEDKTELKTEEKSEISVEDSAKTNESKTSVENEASEKKEKKPTRTFSWIGGAGGPMFFPGGSASTVKVDKTTENNTADGIKTEALNAVQKEALRQAEEKFFYENLKTLGGAMAADGYKEMYYESFLRPLKKPEAGSPELASFDERNKLHNESIEKMKAFESKFNLDKIKADVGRAISSNAKLEFGIGLYRIDASRNELQNIIDDKRSSEEEKQKAMEELAMLDQVKEGFLENIGSHQGERYSNEEYASVPENEKKNANRYLFLQKVR
ncbi:MAG: hypothetical protein HXL10_00310 [Candidatus Nanosynbacter sp.]|nr:hypothetical protein [Candidatus Nanosynbacter sp.]